MKTTIISALLAGLAGLALIALVPSPALACDGVSKAQKTETLVASGQCGGGAAAVKASATAKAKAPKVFDKAPAVGTKATCPVMGGEFEVKADSQRSEHKGKHVVFCCPGCKPKFDAEPAKYL